MATTLSKDVTRESTEKFDDREIMVTLSSDQTIIFKLKGKRSGKLSIPIKELYNQLAGVSEDTDKSKEPISITRNESKTSGKVLIDLNELRSANAISTASTQVISQVDGIIKTLLDARRG